MHAWLLVHLRLITLLPSLTAQRRSVLWPNDGSYLRLFQMVKAWLPMSVIGPIVVLFVFFLCSGYRSPLSPFFCFIIVVLIICVSVWRFTDVAHCGRALCKPNIYLWFKAASESLVRFHGSKTSLRTLAVFQLTVPRRFLCCSLLFMEFFCRCFFFSLFVPYLSSFGASGRLRWLRHFLSTSSLICFHDGTDLCLHLWIGSWLLAN